MSKRDQYLKLFTAAMKKKGADPTQVIAKLATRFRVTNSAVLAHTRELRTEMGLVRTRPNGKEKVSKAAAGRMGGLRAQQLKRQSQSSKPVLRQVPHHRPSKRPDLVSMSVDDAARLLQVLSMEWPALRAAFLALDAAMVKP